MKKGSKHSEESRKKMSASATGRKLSDETKEKMSISASGKIRTSEHQRKLNESHTGKKRSVESRKKMSDSAKKYWKDHPENKEVASKRTTEYYQIDEHKKQQSERLKKYMSDSEHKKRLSEKAKKLWTDNEFKQWYSKRMVFLHKLHPEWSREHNPNWKNGKSFEKYCPKFNNEFKKNIRKKFQYMCFLCNKLERSNNEKLCIHHIDYNKNSICNGKKWSFVTLCRSCHGKTNHNRWYWFNLLINYWAIDSNNCFNANFEVNL